MTKDEYDEMVDALESTTPSGIERDLKRHGVDTTRTEPPKSTTQPSQQTQQPATKPAQD
jgi:hypothetical protein